MLRTITLATLLALAANASAQSIDGGLEPVYRQGADYTATLHSSSQHWSLDPMNGDAVDIRSAELCPRTALPPRGLWLLGRDAEGRAELVAPSATLLPQGHSGRVALRSCDDPELRNAQVEAVGVPRQLLNLLLAETGAVLVDD